MNRLYTILLFLVSLQLGFAQVALQDENPDILEIHRGDQKLLYNLSTGKATYYVNERAVISEFYAEVRLPDIIKSSQYSNRTYLVLGDKVVITNTADNYPTMRQTFFIDATNNIKTNVSIESSINLSSNYMAALVADGAGSVDIGGGDQIMPMPGYHDNGTTWNFSKSDDADNLISYNVGVFFNNDSRNGLVIGAVTHKNWKTGIYMTGNNGKLDKLKVVSGVKYERDALPHGHLSGMQITSSTICFGLYEDFREGLKDFAQENLKVQPAALRAPSLDWDKDNNIGWKSDGQGSQKSDLTYTELMEVCHYMRTSLIPAGFKNKSGKSVIALDSNFRGYFSTAQWWSFAEYVTSMGHIPGSYFVPFQIPGSASLDDQAFGGSEYTYGDIALRDSNGDLVEIQKTNNVMYCIDPTHPGTLARIDKKMDNFIEHGFKWLRFDFAYMGMMEGDFYEESITTGIQAYNYAMQYITDKTKGKVHFNYAIASYFPYQWVHSRRISGDVYYDIESIKYELNSLAGSWWMGNGTLHQNLDPGSVCFNPDEDDPELCMSQINAAAITGTLQSDDDWNSSFMKGLNAKYLTDPEVMEVVRNGWSFMPVELNCGTGTPNSFIHYDEDTAYLAVFNFSEKNIQDQSINLNRIFGFSFQNYNFFDVWSNEEFSVSGLGKLEITLPAKGSELYKITPKAGESQTVDMANFPFDKPVWIKSLKSNKYITLYSETSEAYAAANYPNDESAFIFRGSTTSDTVTIEAYNGDLLQYNTTTPESVITADGSFNDNSKYVVDYLSGNRFSLKPAFQGNNKHLQVSGYGVNINGEILGSQMLFEWHTTNTLPWEMPFFLKAKANGKYLTIGNDNVVYAEGAIPDSDNSSFKIISNHNGAYFIQTSAEANFKMFNNSSGYAQYDRPVEIAEGSTGNLTWFLPEEIASSNDIKFQSGYYAGQYLRLDAESSNTLDVLGTSTDVASIFTCELPSEEIDWEYIVSSGGAIAVEEPILISEITIFPSPVDQELNIDFGKNVGACSVVVCNLQGQECERINIEITPVSKVNLSNLSQGIYIINIENHKGNIYTNKFIKK